jgi:hypothetical protein
VSWSIAKSFSPIHAQMTRKKSHYDRPVDGIFARRRQFDSAAAFAQGVIFSAKPGVDKTKHAKCRAVIGLRVHDALLRGAGGCKAGVRRCRVTFPPCELAFTECAAELDGVRSVGIVTEIGECSLGRTSIALSRSQKNAKGG